jgi:hypothetical protein
MAHPPRAWTHSRRIPAFERRGDAVDLQQAIFMEASWINARRSKRMRSRRSCEATRWFARIICSYADAGLKIQTFNASYCVVPLCAAATATSRFFFASAFLWS